jgi:8-oxo-dGTP pyrophosphatase MutT (NUDIX family)
MADESPAWSPRGVEKRGKHATRPPPTRHSYGIILCRYSTRRQRYEFLLEQRPYRYGFVQLVMHRYTQQHRSQILRLMDDMSPEDKVALTTLRFDSYYRRIYQAIPGPGHDGYARYLGCRAHFERHFLADGGEWLLTTLNRSQANGLHWDLPRGHKANAREKDLNCAVREFEEETRIPSTGMIILHPDAKVHRYQSSDHCYHNHYWLAGLRDPRWHHPNNLRIDYTRPDQLREVIDLRWMGLQELSAQDALGRLSRFLRDMVRVLQNARVREQILYDG